MEKRLVNVADRLKLWQNRLSVKAIELTGMMNRQVEGSAGLLVSSAQRSKNLDFVFIEREEEGRLSIEFKKISADIRQSLNRLSRPETWELEQAKFFPAYAEIRKNQVFEPWRPLQQKLDTLSEETLHMGLLFEEGRQRLRGIYETVQKMKIVEPALTAPRPFLHRLFNLTDD
jgi:hypothetical protein